MNPEDLLYTEAHVWVLVEDDVATVGVTRFLAESLGEIVRIDMAEPGDQIPLEGHLGDLEGLHSDEEVISPLDGVILEINQEVFADPALIAADPYSEGWLAKLRVSDPSQLQDLLGAGEYNHLVRSME